MTAMERAEALRMLADRVSRERGLAAAGGIGEANTGP